MKQVDPQLLADGALEYAFLESCGMEIFGSAGGPFVMRGTTDNSLLMFRGDDENIEHMSLTDPLSLFPFTAALKYSACFTVQDGIVTCEIGDVCCTGLTYSEAAMRAVVVYNRMRKLHKIVV